jgi:hypothetical protein
MKQDEQIDELFRKKLSTDYSVEIPGDYISDINQRLDELERNKKRKKAPVFWWIGGVFSITIIVVLVYCFQRTYETSLIETTKRKSDISVNLKPITKLRPQQINNQNEPRQPHQQSFNGEINHESFQNNLQKTQSFSNSTSTVDPKKNTNYELESLKNKESNLDSLNSQKSQLNVFSESIKELIIDTISTHVSAPMNTSEDTAIILKNSEVKDSLTKEIEPQKINPIEFDSLKKVKKIMCSTITLFSGVSGIFHTVSAPNSSALLISNISSEFYREKRKMEEKSITSWDLAIRYGIQFRGFTFSSGIDYFVWGEQTNYSNVTYNANYKNNYHFLNIPLFLGYQLQKGSFGLQPIVGFSFGILAKEASGFYLNIDNSNSSYQAAISKTIGTLHAGLEIAYFSQSGIKVSISPTFRKSITPVVQSDLVKNNYYSVGLQLGIGYRW